MSSNSSLSPSGVTVEAGRITNALFFLYYSITFSISLNHESPKILRQMKRIGVGRLYPQKRLQMTRSTVPSSKKVLYLEKMIFLYLKNVFVILTWWCEVAGLDLLHHYRQLRTPVDVVCKNIRSGQSSIQLVCRTQTTYMHYYVLQLQVQCIK